MFTRRNFLKKNLTAIGGKCEGAPAQIRYTWFKMPRKFRPTMASSSITGILESLETQSINSAKDLANQYITKKTGFALNQTLIFPSELKPIFCAELIEVLGGLFLHIFYSTLNKHTTVKDTTIKVNMMLTMVLDDETTLGIIETTRPVGK